MEKMSSELAGLAETIAALRRELLKAVDEGAGKDVRFQLGPVEIEFQMGVSKEAGAEAGVKFWVLTLGGRGKVAQDATHHVKVSLQPVDREGRVLPVAEAVSKRPD